MKLQVLSPFITLAVSIVLMATKKVNSFQITHLATSIHIRTSVSPPQSCAVYHMSRQLDEDEKIKAIIKPSVKGKLHRRNFLFQTMTSLATIAGLENGLLTSPTSADAKEGYIPDMVGGFKKPKGLGGLPKKIKAVGHVLVRGYSENIQIVNRERAIM